MVQGPGAAATAIFANIPPLEARLGKSQDPVHLFPTQFTGIANRVFNYGNIEYGLGVEKTDDDISGKTNTDGRAFLQWRSSH